MLSAGSNRGPSGPLRRPTRSWVGFSARLTSRSALVYVSVTALVLGSWRASTAQHAPSAACSVFVRAQREPENRECDQDGVRRVVRPCMPMKLGDRTQDVIAERPPRVVTDPKLGIRGECLASGQRPTCTLRHQGGHGGDQRPDVGAGGSQGGQRRAARSGVQPGLSAAADLSPRRHDELGLPQHLEVLAGQPVRDPAEAGEVSRRMRSLPQMGQHSQAHGMGQGMQESGAGHRLWIGHNWHILYPLAIARVSAMLRGNVRRGVVTVFLAAVAASVLGDTAMMLVAGIWMKTLTGSDALAALTTLCLWGPTLAARWLGPIADRVRPGLVLTVVPGTVAVLLLPLSMAPERWLPAVIFAAMTAYGIAFVVLGAAEAALLPRILPRDALARVNGYRAGIQEGGGKIIAPALGAGLFVVAGPQTVVLVTVMALLLSATLFHLLDRRTGHLPAARSESAEPTGAPTPSGLRRLAATVGLGMFAAGVNGALLYQLVDTTLHRPPAFIGVMAVAAGCGAAGMSIGAGRIYNRFGVPTTASAGLALAASGYLLLATGTVAGAMLGSFLGGAGLPLALVALLTHAQTSADPSHIGGTVARAFAWASIPLPIGTLVGAFIVGHVPATAAYVGTAALAAAAAVTARRSVNGPIPIDEDSSST